ncbi:hypothetical protein [Paludisphaera sp.]|uniref:hypothetical protein n=1 Tax=Paludisphaera sp. TaxID=2017432 RepID=UPI00301E2DDD
MAVTLKNSGRLVATTANTPFNNGKFTLSFYFRVNSSVTGLHYLLRVGETWLAGLMAANGVFALRVYTANSLNLNGAVGVSAVMPNLRRDVVYHAVLVYDPDDPSRRFLAVNTDKTPLSTSGPPLVVFNGVRYGDGSTDDVTIQDAFFLQGHAASDSEIATLAGDLAATPAFVASALVPGSLSFYHTLAGDVAAEVSAGAPGISWAGPPAFNALPSPRLAGGIVAYAEPMASDATLTVKRAFIGPSGKTLTLAVGPPSGDVLLAPRVGSLNAFPSIRVDGGPPIALPTAGAYVATNADALFFPLPSGMVVSEGQSVVLDAPANWFPAAASMVPAISGHPVANYVGKSIAAGLWPDAKPIRVGTQNEGIGRTMAVRPHANVAKLLTRTGMERWPDGTFRGQITGVLVNNGSGNSLDIPGYAGRSGLWLVRWDDHDPAKPVDVSLSDHGSAMRELVAYRNDGDAQGRGKVRVYDLDMARRWNYTLSSPIDAAATSIPYSTVDEIASFQVSRVPIITIGDETILVGTRDFATKRFTGCTRGWNGTTAKSHAAGRPFTVHWGAKYATINISITSADPANTHYANLEVYEVDPSELPELQPGEKFEYPARDPLEISGRFKKFVKDGVGVLRYMSETPGMAADTEHPEQYVRPEDPHYSGATFIRKYHFREVRPFNPAETPYFYTPTPWPATERYTTTLGSPITTAPPPGTVETISLPNGRADGVIKGQSLFVGDEVMRVLEVPLSGGAYKVKRGEVGTATSTHPAGEIEVGYRIPITSAAQYITPAARHYYTAIIDENLSSPVEFGNINYSKWAGSDDANLTARLALTLTAPLNATSRDVFAAPADPNDWDLVARNLRLVIGAETLVVTAVDRPAGKITVASRPSGAASYPAGTGLRTKAAGLLLRSPDGTKKSYNNLFHTSTIILATGVDRAVMVTSDESTGLGGASTAALPQFFDAPNTCNQPEEFPHANHPYEFTARETAESPGAWHWLNVPWRGPDAAVYEAAKAVRDNLPPGRPVVFELGNELWNSRFHAYAGMYTIGGACRIPNVKDMYILRTQSAFEVARRCFAEVGREDEILMSICWQTSNDVLADCRRLGVEPDVVAHAPYIMPKFEWAAYTAAFDAVDDDQACDLFTFYLFHINEPGTLRGVGAITKASREAHEKATGKRPIYATYEGGLEQVVGLPSGATSADPRARRTRDIIHRPAFYFTELDSYAAMREVVGVDVYTQLALGGAVGTKFWTMLWGPGQEPGRGDGRGGGVDNSAYSFSNPTDLLAGGGDGVRESLRLQAWLDYQAAWRTTTPPGPDPVDPNPDDTDPTPDPDPDPDPGSDPDPGQEPPLTFARKPLPLVYRRFRPRFG